ncbi:TonB-dependent receptor plug domain-containing protein, partial [Flavobacterium sp.]|uniref:TonB-dependent receptor plug domain-containing protein n=1 Tax=Flavobacterium sp. TaxID=239 RepID=UPI003782E609
MKSLSIALCLLASAFTFAQETPKTEDKKSSENPNELKEVTLYGNKKQYLKVESDKTTISVRENPMLNSGSSLEAVKKIPGVITSPTGTITLNSRGVTIYIDGAPSTLSGNDLQNYLSTLPANAIEKVELIYNPGASFDADASGSIINIVTSTKRKKGLNASVNMNYNFNQYQKPSPQILLNGKVKELSWQTMIGYNYIDSENNSSNDQIFTSFSPNER